MPNGKTHTMMTLALAGPVALIAGASGGPAAAAAAGIGTLAGIIISPDLDIDTGFIGNFYLRKIPLIGLVLSGTWRVIWWPYARAIGHRSRFSHTPIIGTVGRVGWLALWMLIICLLFQVPFPAPPPEIVWALIGLAAADTLHILADAL